jgi:ELWxxDGT repeat protein
VPSLVKDIQSGPAAHGRRNGSFVRGVAPVTLGSTTWFLAAEASTGYEIWKTDGSAEGTRLLREFNPGPAWMEGAATSLAAVGDTLYLSTEPGGPLGAAALWKSDGTFEGTVRIPLSTENYFWPVDLLSCGGRLFFQNRGFERGVWSSDGTVEGTRKLAPVLMYPSPFSGGPQRAACANGTLFFVGSREGDQEELWTSDGTPEGTVSLGYFSVEASWDGSATLAAVGSRVFFSVAFGGLWTSDGTLEGTVRLGDDSGPIEPQALTVAGGTLYFRARDASYTGGLWASDGTAAGTRKLAGLGLSSEFRAEAVGDTLLFSDGGGLYRSNGTPEATVLVHPRLLLHREPGAAALLPDGRWVLSAREGSSTEGTLWVGDETGTVPLLTARGQSLQGVQGLRRQGDHVLFWADDGLHGLEPWVTDGTPEGTHLVRDIFREDASTPWNLTDGDGTLFFSAQDAEHGRELWKSDGTPEGTLRLTDVRGLAPGSELTGPVHLTPVEQTLFFFHDHPLDGSGTPARALWKTDGTPEGTVLLHEGLSRAYTHVTGGLGTTFFFSNHQPLLGEELWKSDGTPEGTRLVKDIHPSHGSASPARLTSAGARLFFTAEDGVHGRELWKTDGTAEGTLLVKDLFPGGQGSAPTELVAVGATLFFFADDGVHGRDLWKTDGTAEGTVLVKDLPAASTYHGLFGLVAREGSLFFIADDGVHGRELWKSDGTAEGTEMVADIAPGAASAFPSSYAYHRDSQPLSAVGGTLYFAADDGVHGSELWKSDGTAEGTVLVEDLTPGAGSSPLRDTRRVAMGPRGAFAFSFANEAGGLELWMSDGTQEGTRLLADVAPGPISASPSTLTVSGERLFFVADEGEHGRELWSVDQGAFYPPPQR